MPRAFLMRMAAIGCLLVGSVRAYATPVPEPFPLYTVVTGEEVVHAVRPGESLSGISSRLGMQPQLVAAVNGLPRGRRLRKGDQVRLTNRRIIPARQPTGIVVNLSERTLYWVQDGELVRRFPVGVGKQTWKTPTGNYTITGRRRDPVWHVPPSIQREMKAAGHTVVKEVAPGPGNPLGKYWLQLSAGGIGIHGTNSPSSIGRYATHGCIRMRAKDIEWLFKNVPDGTSVDVIDEPVKVALLQDGTILMESNRAMPKQVEREAAVLTERMQASGLAEFVDGRLAERVVRGTWGVAVTVGAGKPRAPVGAELHEAKLDAPPAAATTEQASAQPAPEAPLP